ncbi:hypothetical protein CKJ84_05430 [Corynebacterium sp. NML 120412]|nr:hypothetical protein CKJ84_05430 [Corynebacterium sp. NML 120412]
MTTIVVRSRAVACSRRRHWAVVAASMAASADQRDLGGLPAGQRGDGDVCQRCEPGRAQQLLGAAGDHSESGARRRGRRQCGVLREQHYAPLLCNAPGQRRLPRAIRPDERRRCVGGEAGGAGTDFLAARVGAGQLTEFRGVDRAGFPRLFRGPVSAAPLRERGWQGGCRQREDREPHQNGGKPVGE